VLVFRLACRIAERRGQKPTPGALSCYLVPIASVGKKSARVVWGQPFKEKRPDTASYAEAITSELLVGDGSAHENWKRREGRQSKWSNQKGKAGVEKGGRCGGVERKSLTRVLSTSPTWITSNTQEDPGNWKRSSENSVGGSGSSEKGLL